jgi:hypothetical protein
MSKIAYLILCHRDPQQFARLIAALDTDAEFFVHVDAKAPAEQFRSATKSANVHFIADRIKVYWGGFSIVQATLNLMLAGSSRGHYDRYVLLNGLDYPIKPTSRILAELRSVPDKEFIRFFNIREAHPSYVDDAVRYHFLDAPRILVNRYYDARPALKKTLGRVRRRLPAGYIHVFGHMQWALSDPCVRWILGTDAKDSRLRDFYKHSFAPDERYIHTIVANSPFGESAGGIEPYREYGTFRMANLHHIDPSLNKTFTERDFDELASSEKFFVKKITTEQSMELVDLIDARLRREGE